MMSCDDSKMMFWKKEKKKVHSPIQAEEIPDALHKDFVLMLTD